MKLKLLFILLFISLQVYSQKLDLLIHKADSALDKGNVTIALQLYSKAIKIDTNNAYLYIRRGICFKYLDDNKSAITDLTKGLYKSTLLENKLLAHKERGKAYRNSKMYFNAFKDFIVFGYYNQNDKLNNELLGECLDKVENFDSCRNCLTQLLAEFSSNMDNSYLYFYRSIFNSRLSNSNDVISDLNNMKLDFKKSNQNDTVLEYKYEYNFRLAARYYYMDSLDLALKHINQCLNLIPFFEQALYLKVDILVDRKEFDSAGMVLKKMEKDRYNIEEINKYWGVIFYRQKKYKEAISSFKKSISKNQNDTYSLNKIGFCYSKLKQYPEAIKFYSISIKIDSSDASVYNSISWDLFLMKKYTEGIPFIDKCLKLDSTNANYFDTKACLLYGLNQLDESIIYFNKAISLKSDLINSYVYRARANIKLNNKKDVCQDIEMIKLIRLKANFNADEEDLKIFEEKYCK